jgi:hypothetical protein
MTWKFTDETRTVVSRVLANGWLESKLASTLESLEGVEAPDAEDYRTPMLEDFKARREVYLNRLTGIAGRAMRAGNTSLASAADTFSEGLLVLPDKPSVVSAADAASLKNAIMYEYVQLVNAAVQTSGAKATFDKVSK